MANKKNFTLHSSPHKWHYLPNEPSKRFMQEIVIRETDGKIYLKDLKEYDEWKIGALEREKKKQIAAARALLREHGKLK
jgi:hypothetical protein